MYEIQTYLHDSWILICSEKLGILKIGPRALAWWLSWLKHCTIYQKKKKGCGFDFWLGHIPRLRLQSLVGVHTGGDRSMFLTLMFLSQINKHILG